MTECTKSTGHRTLFDIVTLSLVLLIVSLVWYGAWQWIDSNVVAESKQTVETKDATDAKAKATSAEDYAVRGQFGDKFGAVNALFSGFAFAGIIFTIFLQRRDLRETHEAMAHERFDNTFFQLLQVHITISEKVVVRSGYTGKQAFEAFNNQLKLSDPDFPAFCGLQKLTRDQIRAIIDTGNISRELFPALDDSDITNLNECRKTGVGAFNNYLDTCMIMHERKMVDAYIKAAVYHIDEFSHYFRNIYHILKFIDESSMISGAERQRYSRFVRSQLSQVELVTLFYNSIAKIALPGREHMELGHPKMGRLLQKYDILQNLNPRGLIHPLHREIFSKNNPGDVSHAN